jgi:hypothetical protein
MKRLIAGLLFVAMAAPALAHAAPAILPVHAVSASASGVTVRVPPWGCTPRKSDLTVAVAVPKTGGRPLLLIARRRPDDARACSDAVPADITWRYDDLGLDVGQPFALANPLVAEGR